MIAIKITVLKRALHTDLAGTLSGREIKKCELFTEGQEFITGIKAPEGFCQWAWNDISRMALAVYTGGQFDQGIFQNWMKQSGTAVACCTDGLRPVTFKLERIDTTSLMDVSGAERPAPLEVYDSERWGEFSYAFPELKAGEQYKVWLHFCETYHAGPGKRCFNVKVGGRMVLENYDIIADTGARYKAAVKEFEAAADKNGLLVIDFVKGAADYPKISAIEIIAQETGSAAADPVVRPVYAVNAGGDACEPFSADKYFTGGNAVTD
jgi:uncharacterized repeat protein (TIGR04076 family)